MMKKSTFFWENTFREDETQKTIVRQFLVLLVCMVLWSVAAAYFWAGNAYRRAEAGGLAVILAVAFGWRLSRGYWLVPWCWTKGQRGFSLFSQCLVISALGCYALGLQKAGLFFGVLLCCVPVYLVFRLVFSFGAKT